MVLSLHDAFYLCHRLFLLDRDGRAARPEQGERCVACLADVAAADDARHRFDFMARRWTASTRWSHPRARWRSARRRAAFAGAIAHVGRHRGARPPPRTTRDRRAGAPAVHRHGLPHKGLDLLVDAVRGLDPARWELRIHGAGVGGHVADLRERSRDLPVQWCGRSRPGVCRRSLGSGRPGAAVALRRVVLAWCARRAPRVSPWSHRRPGSGEAHEVDALWSRRLVARSRHRAAAADRRRLPAGAPAAPPRGRQSRRRCPARRCSVSSRVAGAQVSGGGAVVPRVTVAYVTERRTLARRRWARSAASAARSSWSRSSSTRARATAARDPGAARRPDDPHRASSWPRHDAQPRGPLRGHVVVFLTQDASPANDDWLAPLVAALVADPLLAGVWSRHAPRPGCHPMEWRNLVEFPLFQPGHPRVARARAIPTTPRASATTGSRTTAGVPPRGRCAGRSPRSSSPRTKPGRAWCSRRASAPRWSPSR